MLSSIADFFKSFLDTLELIADTLDRTIVYIDNVTFNDSIFALYLGYVRWLLGDYNYYALTTMFLIAMGVTLWSVSLKIVGYLKNLLPW